MDKIKFHLMYLSLVVSVLLMWMLVACVQDPKSIPEGDRVAILSEGLGDQPFLANALREGLVKQGYTVISTTYKYKGPIKAKVCAGHSFGGGRMMRNDVTCDIVLTFDAREWDASKNDSYKTRHKVHYNFWEKQDLLRGYPIEGAVNIEVKANHIGLPKAAATKALEITAKGA